MLVLALFASLAGTVAVGATESAASTIGTLGADDLSSAHFECDCEFYRDRVDEKTVVFATREHRTIGLAKIDGSTLRLHPVVKSRSHDCRKGERFDERWSDGSVSIDLEGAATTTGAEACWYRAWMTVTKDARRETIPVTGSCGC